VLSATGPVFHKLVCGVVQRHLWCFFVSLSAELFGAICGGFSQVYLRSGSAPSVVVFHKLIYAGLQRRRGGFHKLICAGTKRNRAGFSQASLRSCSAPSVVVFHMFIGAVLQRHLWWFFTSLSAQAH
jgi:hypothetical protein